ncbi:MAG: tRNA(fMet)-specific endonuclease VapC [Acidimicrobiales bacterium]|nr:tRNA(fMet)-specific endonuclease VapC [Acidimicrobiales bacterium]
MTAVLDSWAVLSYLENTEPAATVVAGLLDGERPLMSWINLGEVHCVIRRSHGEDDAMEAVRDLRDVIDVRLPDERLVLEAARLKADHPMAYADAFGAALAIAEGATLWTGDPELLMDGSPWRWHDLRERR